MTNLDYALQYAALGWKVFPLHYMRDNGQCSCGQGDKCKHPGKHPATFNGVKDATNDPEKIKALFRDSRLNIGAEADPFQVIDVDPRNGGDNTWSAYTKNKALPDTAIQISGGGGLHFLYAVPTGKRLKKPGIGVDIKKAGGYIVVEPSNHESGNEYYWDGAFSPLDGQIIAPAPEWMLEDLAPARPSTGKPSTGKGAGFLLESQVKDIQAALSFLDADDYEIWIQVGQALHSTGSSVAFDMWDGWSQTSDKYTAGETSKKWNTFHNDGGLNIESIFYWAEQNGWINQPIVDDIEIDIRLTPREEAESMPQIEIPIPPELLCPPGILKDIANQITQTARMPQPVYSVNAALSLVATLAAQQVQNETGLRTNLYLVSLGATGSGKEHARNYIKNALHALGKDDQIGGEDIASGQALMTRASISPNAIFQIDELGKYLQEATDKNAASHKISVLTNLMKLFSSASSVVTGTEYANQRLNERQTIEYPCINLHGTSTDTTFYDALKGVHILDGFVNRIIVTQTDMPRPKKQRIKPATKPTEAILQWHEQFITAINHGKGMLGIQPEQPHEIKMTKSAWDEFNALDAWIDQKMEETRGTGLDALYVRVWEHAAKIALVCGCAMPEPIIDRDQAAWAIKFVTYWTERLVTEARFRISDSEFGRTMNLVLKQISKGGKHGLSEGKIFNYRHLRETPPKVRREVLAALVGNGEVIVNEPEDKRAARKFIINT